VQIVFSGFNQHVKMREEQDIAYFVIGRSFGGKIWGKIAGIEETATENPNDRRATCDGKRQSTPAPSTRTAAKGCAKRRCGSPTTKTGKSLWWACIGPALLVAFLHWATYGNTRELRAASCHKLPLAWPVSNDASSLIQRFGFSPQVFVIRQ
jgi:hypothetical protein